MTRYTFLVALAAVSTGSAMAQAPVCSTYMVDFGGFERGETITTQLYDDYGIEVVCDSEEGYGCRIFDTAVPWGEWVSGSGCACSLDNCSESKKNDCGDPDLGSPHNTCDVPGYGEGNGGKKGKTYENCEPRGNVLVIDEHGPDKPPDDTANGGKIRFLFDYPTDLEQICFLDVDGEESVKVSVYFEDGTSIKGLPVPKIGDGGYGCIPIQYNAVSKLVIVNTGSGSVSDLQYNMCRPPKGGGGGGDPHVKRWNRERSTFHGECDLVMAHSDKFHDGAGLDFHVRATMHKDLFSYFEEAALRVGDHTLEMHKHEMILDGTSYSEEEMPLTFGEGEFKYTIDNAEIEEGKSPLHRKHYKLTLGDDSHMLLKWYRHMLTVEVSGDVKDFVDSVGLMGDYRNGDMIARDGSLMADFNEFGFEWQVNPTHDPILFKEAREPQLPYEKCRMPSQTMESRRRKLRGNQALMEQAQSACSAKVGGDFQLCVDDVLMTGDIEMAHAW